MSMKAQLSVYDPILKHLEKLTGTKHYVCGGAVRDAAMGRPNKDIDVVTVSTPEHLTSLGFTPIKKDFPVYTHPHDPVIHGIEVALARGEKKTGAGHSGFDWHLANNVHDDSVRRDFTINSMMYNHDDGLIDYHNGMQDIHSKTLRHVSSAFSEDPLRTFRGARFAAQVGFHVHPTTTAMMRSTNPELPSLSKERVREEMHKALNAKHPSHFFETLKASDSMHHWLPEFHSMRDRVSPHSSSDAYTHTMKVLDHAAKHGASDGAKEFLLTQHMHPEEAKAFGNRFGFGKNQLGNWASHAELQSRFYTKPTSAMDVIHHYRRVRAIDPAHSEASRINHAVGGRPHHMDEYRKHFMVLADTKIAKGSDKDAVLKQYHSSLRSKSSLGEAISR